MTFEEAREKLSSSRFLSGADGDAIAAVVCQVEANRLELQDLRQKLDTLGPILDNALAAATETVALNLRLTDRVEKIMELVKAGI